MNEWTVLMLCTFFRNKPVYQKKSQFLSISHFSSFGAFDVVLVVQCWVLVLSVFSRLMVRSPRTFLSTMQASWLRSLAESCSWSCRETDSRCWFASRRWKTVTLSSTVSDLQNWKAAGPILHRGRPGEGLPSSYVIHCGSTSYESTLEMLLLLLYLIYKICFPFIK